MNMIPSGSAKTLSFAYSREYKANAVKERYCYKPKHSDWFYWVNFALGGINSNPCNPKSYKIRPTVS